MSSPLDDIIERAKKKEEEDRIRQEKLAMKKPKIPKPPGNFSRVLSWIWLNFRIWWGFYGLSTFLLMIGLIFVAPFLPALFGDSLLKPLEGLHLMEISIALGILVFVFTYTRIILDRQFSIFVPRYFEFLESRKEGFFGMDGTGWVDMTIKVVTRGEESLMESKARQALDAAFSLFCKTANTKFYVSDDSESRTRWTYERNTLTGSVNTGVLKTLQKFFRGDLSVIERELQIIQEVKLDWKEQYYMSRPSAD